MPYLPPRQLQTTEFPQAWDPDLFTQIGLIEELWNEQKPTVQYESLLKGNVEVADVNTPSGIPGTSFFDTLWGEDVDSAYAAANGQWIQPHLSGVAQAADVDVFAPAFGIKADPMVIDTDETLKKYCVDSRRARIGHLMVLIPLSLFDKAGVFARMGDRITWDDDEWSVIETMEQRQWMNTNVRLYMRLICMHYRHGS